MTKITFLKEFVFLKVFAAWFVILVKEFNNGTLLINGSKKFFTLSQTCPWFITNHNNQINQHNTKNHKKCTTTSGNQNLFNITSGNNDTIFQTQLKTKDIIRQSITKNKTVGKISNNHVRKWLFNFLFSSSMDLSIIETKDKVKENIIDRINIIFLLKKTIKVNLIKL